jgi:anti-sigma regulatory factor (Ser/Thr protein kinase)
VTIVRCTLSALAEAGELEPELTDDLKTAVSEACNNVVLHAYPGATGRLMTSIAASCTEVQVVVEDHGTGIRQVAASDDRIGVGLAVISALADRAEFRTGRDAGTTVRMTFKRPGAGDHAGRDRRDQQEAEPGIELAGEVVLWLSPVSALRIVLGRLLRAVAATSHFTVDSMCELHAVSEALGTYAERFAADTTIGFAIDASPRRLRLIGGPFLPADGDGSEPPAPVDAGGPDWHAAPRPRAGQQQLSALVEQLMTVQCAGCELLAIVLVDHNRDC